MSNSRVRTCLHHTSIICFCKANNLVLEDLITVVSIVKILNKDSHESNHGKTSIVDFPVLVINPSLITIINPVRSSEDITWLVSRACLDLLREPLNSTTSENELKPSNGRKLLGSLERVGGECAIECGVYSSSGDVPSETGGHGDASVLELGFTVHGHDLVGFSGGESEGIEESHGGGHSYDGLVLPCVEGGAAGSSLGDGGKGRTVLIENVGENVEVRKDIEIRIYVPLG